MDAQNGDGETDMTADNIAPEDVPTPDPANTEVSADSGPTETTETKEDQG